MRPPLICAAALFAVLCLLQFGFGYEGTYRLAYGALGLMSCAISATFFWLWRMNATPLAAGMVLSWAGGGGMLGYWWCYALLGAPAWMISHPIVLGLASVYLVGACLHFMVIGGSFNWPRWGWATIAFTAVVAAIAFTLAMGLAFRPM